MERHEVVPVGGSNKFALFAVRAVSTLKSVGQNLRSKFNSQFSPTSRVRRIGADDVVDVECSVLSSDRTLDVIGALREKRFIDAAELLHGNDVDFENAELLYLLGIHREELSLMGMVFDFDHAIDKSANSGFAEAQMEMAKRACRRYANRFGVYNPDASQRTDAQLEILRWLELAALKSGKASLACARIYDFNGFIVPKLEIVGIKEFGNEKELWRGVTNVFKAKTYYEKAMSQGVEVAGLELQTLLNRHNAGVNTSTVSWR